MKTTDITLLMALFCMNLLCGQEFYFEHYKVEDGLSHNTILSSLQDQKGFLWFGTKNGLNRFDGYNFRLFQNDPDNSTSLQSNYIECLHEYKNKVWVGTDNGLYHYNDRFENFDIVKNTINKNITDIENDTHGKLWYIADGTLYNYNTSNEAVQSFPRENFFYPTDIVKTDKGEIWVASTNSLYHYTIATNSFEKFALDVSADFKRPFIINRLFNLDKRTLLLGTRNHGVVAFDILTKQIKTIDPLTKENFYVRNFVVREKDELWVATESGLHVYNLATKKYTNLRKNYDDPYALSDNAVYSLTVDKEGGIWAGTYFGGLNYHPKQYSPFTKFFPMSSQNSINGNAVREIHADDYGNIWVGTEDGGLNQYNPDTGLFKNYTSKDKDKNGILTHYNIHGLLPRGDKIWVGMFENGLDILDIKTNKITEHYNIGEEGALRSNFVFAIYETKANEVFAVTTAGIQTYNSKSNQFDNFEGFPNNLGYSCFFEDNEGVLWAGSYSQGLYFYDPKTKEKGSYTWDHTKKTGISNNHINGIFQDSNNTIWITTENGLNSFNKEERRFKKYTTKDGFPTNVFYALLEDDKGNLWISTSNGLVEFNLATGEKKIYTKANGLLSDQFNYTAAYKDPSGRMYFGSVSGMVSFNPKDFIKNTYAPPIYITGLQIDNEEVVVGQTNSPIEESITLSDHLVLKPSQTSFSLDFAALSYTAPENTEYWYKMEGINNDWIYLNKNHKVYFTELAAGHYNLTVKSLNSSGVWGKETSGLKIEVLPVFWKSNIAFALYVCFAVLSIFFGFRYYHRWTKSKSNQKIKQLKNRKEKEIYQAKIEFFTNVSHEIRTPLTLIKSPLEKILKTVDHDPKLKENLSIMEKNTSRLLDLVNQLLDFRKTELETVNLTFVEVNISELLRKTQTRFSPAIKERNIDFVMNLEPDDIYAYVDTEATKKILSNLFNNAIKYAKSQVIVSLNCSDENLELTVKNDGKLIPSHLKDKIFEPFYRVPGNENQNQSGTGIGLSLAHSLTELHKGSLKLDTSDSTLNCFVLHLPIHQEKEFKLYNSKVDETSKIDGVSKISEIESYKPTVLLVEDNIDLLDFVAKDLIDNYLVIKATNAEKALEMVQQENIQLIVSDVMMPGMDGFMLCEKIKTNIESSHIPVVLLTSKSALNAKIEGLESGADAYIEKPFSMEHLKVQIANLIENRKHIMHYYTSSPLAHIRSIAHTEIDETFIKKLDEVIIAHISDADLNVETLAEIMHMSRSTLYRKIKEMSNLSPNELINVARLKKAAELLRSGKHRIFEVAEIVGYNSPTSFGRNFQKQFEMTPSEYMAQRDI
ncbi:two-component regulator propeller domain-containing protein [uncultured Kriegella sp.]|uniref:hybrid sensor histidine kinase/response regulator transcription factor n=1 Tax=uncultured Kriegella sp. TaxID=1798910 RepID=UPI0030D897BF